MKHHAVVARVGVVLVAEPPSRGRVHLNLSTPVHAPDADMSILEIRSGVGVKLPRVENVDGLSVGGREIVGLEALLGPEVLHERLRHLGGIWGRLVQSSGVTGRGVERRHDAGEMGCRDRPAACMSQTRGRPNHNVAAGWKNEAIRDPWIPIPNDSLVHPNLRWTIPTGGGFQTWRRGGCLV